MKTILAPIDFSGATSSVLEVASELARGFEAKIVLLHVIRPAVSMNEYSPVAVRLPTAVGKRTLEKLLQWQTELQNDGSTVKTSQLHGDPAVCICEEAKRIGADYIVIGSHGHGALYELVVGSTAGEVLKQAPCPVLIVPVTDLRPASPDFWDESGTEAEEARSCRTAD